MLLSEKLKILRAMEGNLRGMSRPLAKAEVVRLIGEELGETISPAYLSQLESGKRPHMTEKTRDMLSRFFKVHPGFFVSDPEGYGRNLEALPMHESQLDQFLFSGAQQFRQGDPDLAAVLHALAEHPATRELLMVTAELARSSEVRSHLKRFMKCLDTAQPEAASVPATSRGTSKNRKAKS